MSDIHAGFATIPRPLGLDEALPVCRPASQFPLEGYLDAMDQLRDDADYEDRTIRIVARSAGAGCAADIWQGLERIRDRRIRVLAVFADPGSAQCKNDLRHHAGIFGYDRTTQSIRLARFRNAHRIIDQIQFGSREVWAAGNKLETLPLLVPANCNLSDPHDVAAARVSFEMIWAVSDEITRKDLNN
jgi:hypothetical protein